MSARLREHLDDLDALVAQTASARGLAAPYVEKDFWVTEVLRAAVVDRDVAMPDGSTAAVTFLFKGGTSLSRVFGIVDRFSEDVDLLAVFPHGAAAAARHRVLKQVDADVTTHLGLTKADVSVGASTTGVKRYTTYHYPVTDYDEGLKEGVLLELGSRGGTHPAGSHSYCSMVADYAIAGARRDPEHLGGVRQLHSQRARARTNPPGEDRRSPRRSHPWRHRILLKHGRHFYDIDRLLGDHRVVAALEELGPHGIEALVDDINAHSDRAEFSWSPRPEGGYSFSPAFSPDHPSNETIQVAYLNAQTLIHGSPVSLDEIRASVAKHRSHL